MTNASDGLIKQALLEVVTPFYVRFLTKNNNVGYYFGIV